MTGTELPEACPDYGDELSAWIDAELGDRREAEIRTHLDSCAGCAAALDELRGVDLALAGVAPPEVPGDLHDRTIRRIESDAVVPLKRGSRGRSIPARWLAPALALAASIAVYVALTGDDSRHELPQGDAAPVTALALDEISEDELAVVLELDTIEDYDVIANLEVLEHLVALGSLDEGSG